MRRVALLGIFLVVGCHEVFGLKKLDELPGTCEALEPGLDADRDGILNGDDLCPTVANQRTDDEDGDGGPDQCDLCPQVVGEAAGDDPDCDGLGAACDPDSTIPHERRFYGFTSEAGFQYDDPSEDGTVGGGQLRMELTSANTSSIIRMDERGARFATYEVAGRIDNALVGQFWNVTLLINDAEGRDYEVQLEKLEATHELRVAIERQGNVIAGALLGKLADANPDFKLRAEVTAAGIDAVVVVDDVAVPVRVTGAQAPMTAPIEYGLYVYRDSASVTTTVRVDYFVYTAPVAQ